MAVIDDVILSVINADPLVRKDAGLRLDLSETLRSKIENWEGWFYPENTNWNIGLFQDTDKSHGSVDEMIAEFGKREVAVTAQRFVESMLTQFAADVRRQKLGYAVDEATMALAESVLLERLLFWQDWYPTIAGYDTWVSLVEAQEETDDIYSGDYGRQGDLVDGEADNGVDVSGLI